MAIWAKNLKVLHVIIMTISVFMMNTKNSRFGIVTTAIALINQFTANHCFSCRGEGRFKCFLRCFINAGFRAIFSIMTSVTNKFIKAMLTCKFSLAFIPLCNIIARSRTVFSFIASGRNMGKSIVTDKAVSCDFRPSIFSLTAARTIF